MSLLTPDDVAPFWTDCPDDDTEAQVYIDAATAACLAYAPLPKPDSAMRFEVTVQDGALTTTDLVFNADVPPNYTGNVSIPAGDAVFSFAYEDGDVIGTTIEPRTLPADYILAISLQARNIYNAGQASPGGNLDPGGYGLSTHPLDWQVKQLLRPARVRRIR